MDDHTFCPLCAGESVEITSIPYTLFEHREFEPMDCGPGEFGWCRTCGIVFRRGDDKVLAGIDEIYCHSDYVNRPEQPRATHTSEFDTAKTMAFLQAEMLTPRLPRRQAAILDIGCFDGRLLHEFASRCGDAYLCGFDVSEETHPRFPAGENFRFVSQSISDVTGCFDLIILSHSIQYIRDIPTLFDEIRRLLRPDGMLFVQVPDLSLRPTILLLGDAHYHFTPSIIFNVFSRFGFSCSFPDNRWFPRDVLAIGEVVAEGDGGRVCGEDCQDGSLLKKTLDHLDAISKKLERLSDGPRLGVLGTTIDAAFVSNLLGPRVDFFVEENQDKIGKTFHGKPVLPLESVDMSDHVILPMGSAGETLCQRLSARYDGNFVCV